MKRIYKNCIFIIIGLSLLGTILFIMSGNNNYELQSKQTLLTDQVHSQKELKGNVISLHKNFYDQRLFNKFIDTYDLIQEEPKNSHLRAMILPHHILVSELIHESMFYAHNYNYKKVIVIGPNHEEIGAHTVSIPELNSSYEMPDGSLLHVNSDLQKSVLMNSFVGVREEIFSKEHSVGAIMPFLKHHLGDVTALPILLKYAVNDRDLNHLLKFLLKQGQETLIIFSIDFSHYLTEELANQHDSATLSLIEQLDYQKILQLTSDNLDSPTALVLALKLQERLNLERMQLYHHNSNEYLSTPTAQTTSYFGFNFYESSSE